MFVAVGIELDSPNVCIVAYACSNQRHTAVVAYIVLHDRCFLSSALIVFEKKM